MKRVVVTVAAVLVVAFLVGFGANALFFGHKGCDGCENDSAPAELQAALTGADTFYTHNDSYAGIDGSGGISDIVTGLTFLPAQPSTGRTVISLATNPQAGWLVMAAYEKEARSCFIVLDLKAKETHPVAGESDGAPGVYYGLIRNAKSATCTASVSMAGTDYATSGFPSGT